MAEVTLKLTTPHMKGTPVQRWQREVKEEFASMGIQCPIVIDGDYGLETRSYTASLARAKGYKAVELLKDGITPEVRSKLRNAKPSMDEVEYRRALRERWNKARGDCALPVKPIIEHSWGYHPPVHDGVDIICHADARLYAVVKSKVIDVRAGGWWGKGAPSAAVAAKGDGIIQLEVLEPVGPFKKGYHIGYGHAEKATVKVGEVVQPGDQIGRAGLANAWHIHWMVNNGNTTKGIGNLNADTFLDYLIKNA